MEEYKKCFEDYEISNFGNVRRMLKNGKYLYIKGSIQNRGYRYFQINRKGKRTNKLFHQLVAKTFLGERPEGLVIDHIDRNKLNNNVSNLRYITFRENLINCDRYRDDIKETDTKKRHNIIQQGYRDKTKEKKTYSCKTCPLVANVRGGGIHGTKRDHKEHMKSQLHIQRLKFIDEMKKNNIEVNVRNFYLIKCKISDYNRGRRKTKPLIYF